VDGGAVASELGPEVLIVCAGRYCEHGHLTLNTKTAKNSNSFIALEFL